MERWKNGKMEKWKMKKALDFFSSNRFKEGENENVQEKGKCTRKGKINKNIAYATNSRNHCIEYLIRGN